MNERIEKLFKFLKEFLDNKKSCQVRLNFHEGNLSEKIEVKETHYLIGEEKEYGKIK